MRENREKREEGEDREERKRREREGIHVIMIQRERRRDKPDIIHIR